MDFVQKRSQKKTPSANAKSSKYRKKLPDEILWLHFTLQKYIYESNQKRLWTGSNF